MKAAHKITDKQKKGTLSAKKEKTKPGKVVLTRNEIEFWPCLQDNQREKFIEILQRWEDFDLLNIEK